MEEMGEPNEPGSHEEKVTFWGQSFTDKDLRLLRTYHSRNLPGCLSRISLPLLLLLVSLGLFFVLLVTMQVQSTSSQKQLEDIQQKLTWMNASLASLCHPCSWNWELFQKKCYFISSRKTTWQASVSACQDQGGQLVIINSVEEQKFLTTWNARRDKRIWIGLSDLHSEGTWHWVDNTVLKLSFWVEGEPNNLGEEDCVELYNPGWNDNQCTAENLWVCEKPSAPCTGL
ncbi:PREDICTED: CD209 antigen-like protein 2-like [Chrysochloris asiatica]|uniref:CD209 antigen-like protein 2-like n=1 Tax=Chrysochloris asiatica TaxID=185453 RepID=A0A9B0WVS0_CHRAS|nr:PREDICTED: CD209 antigen-like protein 2-like [Chrysochloris asiatica]